MELSFVTLLVRVSWGSLWDFSLDFMKLGLNSLLWIVAFLLLGGSAVYFFLTITNLDSPGTSTKTAVQTPANTSAAASSFSGTIVKADGLSAGFGTHRLIGDSGTVSAYLESRNIDLRFLEGSRVTVEGKREKVVGEGIPLIAVDKVNFN